MQPLSSQPIPDPASEIRLVSLRTVRGANFWSHLPVTRLDVAVGAYDEISSADVPGVTDALMAALPGLIEHRCSVGERGGFLARLRRGTYAPHIVEHVGLELQTMIGHDVGYGRARGGDRPGEYTVVFEHLHAEVGLRAAGLALGIVQRAFAGTLDSVAYAVHELRALADAPDLPPLQQQVLCGITGGALRAETRDEMLRRGLPETELVVDLSPAYILHAGVPYARSEIAAILDSQPNDVPERYREPDQAERLVSVVADAVIREGVVIVPAQERRVQELVRDTGRRVAIFATGALPAGEDASLAHAVASVREGRIVLECCGADAGIAPLREEAPVAPQVVAALALFLLDAQVGVPGNGGTGRSLTPDA